MIAELLEIKKEYNDLIDKRIDELELPEPEKTLKTSNFMQLEKRLNLKSLNLKKKLNILATGECDLCPECRSIYPANYKKYYEGEAFEFSTYSPIQICQDHAGKEEIKI